MLNNPKKGLVFGPNNFIKRLVSENNIPCFSQIILIRMLSLIWKKKLFKKPIYYRFTNNIIA